MRQKASWSPYVQRCAVSTQRHATHRSADIRPAVCSFVQVPHALDGEDTGFGAAAIRLLVKATVGQYERELCKSTLSSPCTTEGETWPICFGLLGASCVLPLESSPPKGTSRPTGSKRSCWRSCATPSRATCTRTVHMKLTDTQNGETKSMRVHARTCTDVQIHSY